MPFRWGLNAKQVQVWLGHHSPAFTLATYVHLLPDDLPDPDDLFPETVGPDGEPEAAEHDDELLAHPPVDLQQFLVRTVTADELPERFAQQDFMLEVEVGQRVCVPILAFSVRVVRHALPGVS
jgi:hypothetical protein